MGIWTVHISFIFFFFPQELDIFPHGFISTYMYLSAFQNCHGSQLKEHLSI